MIDLIEFIDYLTTGGLSSYTLVLNVCVIHDRLKYSTNMLSVPGKPIYLFANLSVASTKSLAIPISREEWPASGTI